MDDLFASLAGGQAYSKLNLAHICLDLEQNEESKKLVTNNTQKGLFRYNRLPFGISVGPSIFQQTIKGVLQGISNVTRFEEASMRLKRKKCSFLLPKVEYLGHVISADCLQPTNGKIHDITQAPAVPRDVKKLRAFLGLINYYGKFIKNLSSLLAPHKLFENKRH